MMRIYNDIIRVLRNKERRRFRWLTFAGILVNIADIGSLALLLIVIRFYMQPGMASNWKWMPALLSDPSSPAFALSFLFFFALKNAAAYFIQQAQTDLAYDVALRLSHDLLLRFYNSPFPEQTATDSSVSSRRISQQPIEFGHHVLGGLQQLITQCVLVILAVTAILIYNASTFLLLLLILLPPVLLSGWWLRKRAKQLRQTGRKTSEDSAKYLREALAGYTDARLYGTGSYFMLRYLQQQSKQNKHLASLQNIQAMPSRLIEVFAILGLVLLIILRAQQQAGGLDFMITGAFLGAAYRIIPGIVKILNSLAQMRAFAFTIPELLPAPLPAAPGNTTTPVQTIRFLNIASPSNPLPEGYSGEMKAGELTGISGPSGIGKTTVLQHLLGFRQTPNAVIHINDQVAAGLHKYVAYVPQRSVLLHDTIRENITLGRDVPDKARLEHVLDITGLRTWTDTLPEKLETVISEKGGNISGGQAQRLILARALLEERQVYLLDEPFNELDHASAQQFMEYFRQLAHSGKIVAIVTHDQRCLSVCDKIITLHG